MKNFLKFRHGNTEGEASGILGILLLSALTLAFRYPWTVSFILSLAGGGASYLWMPR
ncbi:exported hypothetical protein [Agrobacterium genomosp. 13 str. CFBP 6927]|uniref:Uncharacterized protein n=1 Tax=Agrobacterium genomosp. 13 str. CFBP 6927 TaxID=1183428 RepID=A0ABM9VDH0_9HYPH|nr:exported hypothetical protein [Agrobacterium genomosp. 13 str. CFBP 6927]